MQKDILIQLQITALKKVNYKQFTLGTHIYAHMHTQVRKRKYVNMSLRLAN